MWAILFIVPPHYILSAQSKPGVISTSHQRYSKSIYARVRHFVRRYIPLIVSWFDRVLVFWKDVDTSSWLSWRIVLV
ncbi:hypothetical protein J3F84DRAFT_359452 [Trichoderma pleuroticola]